MSYPVAQSTKNQTALLAISPPTGVKNTTGFTICAEDSRCSCSLLVGPLDPASIRAVAV
jgi:hypothetical protein